MVTLLMCTICTPKLLLLDEHTAALDPVTAKKVMDITNEIVAENNITTMMITHNMSSALATGDRTIMMDSGRIIIDLDKEQKANMTVSDLLALYREKETKEFDTDRILLQKRSRPNEMYQLECKRPASCMGKGFADFFAAADADLFCLQETKLQAGQIDFAPPGYHAYWNYAEKKGYSGTAIFSKREPLRVQYGMGKEEHDREGRLITLEFPAFYFVTVYVPNSQRELTRLDYRMQWEDDFLLICKPWIKTSR